MLGPLHNPNIGLNVVLIKVFDLGFVGLIISLITVPNTWNGATLVYLIKYNQSFLFKVGNMLKLINPQHIFNISVLINKTYF